MYWRIFISLVIITACLLLWGCSEVSQPEADSQYLFANQSFSMLDDQIEFMERGGIPFVESKAVFSIGWRELMDPSGGTSEIAGHAFATAFEKPVEQRPRPFRGGIDMGSVFINYSSNQIEMNKWTGQEGGVVYMLSHRMRGMTNSTLGFLPNTLYEFEVAGSSGFDPVQLGIISPPGLLEISSHTAGQTISVSEDLILTWSGGMASSGVVLHLHPAPAQRSGINPGPPRGGSPPHGRHPFPPVPLSSNSIVVILDNNPGTYTFSSSDIQEVVNQSGASKIVVGVSQLDVNEESPNGEILRVVMHNRDGLRLSVQ
jgi:hypothetical protein